MYIKTNGIQWHIEESGTGGTTLIFLHYFGGSAKAWQQVIAPLVAEFRCIAPDLRGFGETDAPPDDYSVGAAASDLANLIAALDLGTYRLIGHSMGGKIALAFAAKNLPGLQSLLLVAPSPPTPEPIPDEERSRLLDGFGDRAAAEQTFAGITAKPLAPAERDTIIADNLRSNRAAWNAWLEHGSREDITPLVSRIRVPVQIVVGDCDKSITPALMQQTILPHLPEARLITVPGAAHLLPYESPESLTAACRQCP